MNCFNHPDHPAHGSCKVCMKGLCAQCSTDLEHSLACKGRHEQLANDLHAANLRGASMLKQAGKSKYIAPVFFGFMGLAFLVDAVRSGNDLLSIPVAMGVAFILFGTFALIANVRAFDGSGGGKDAPGR